MNAQPLDGTALHDAFQDVKARLTREFGGVPGQAVEQVVQRWVHSFEGARVTLYLPILIERASRAELSHLAARPASPEPADGPGRQPSELSVQA